MTFIVKESKNIFIDSRAEIVTNHKAKIALPSDSFSCQGDELIRLTLTYFSMRRNFYKINSHNKTFYAFDSTFTPAPSGFPATLTVKEINIVEGDYATLTTLAAAIQTAIVAAGFTGATVSASLETRKLTINMTSATATFPTTAYFCSFQDAKINVDKLNQDTAELLGGVPDYDIGTVGTAKMFGTTKGNTSHISQFPAQLDTIKNIYVTSDLQTNNFETHAFTRSTGNQNSVTSSGKLAIIPVGDETCLYEDSNDLFSIYLQNKQLSQITFDITDTKGRPIPRVSEGQFRAGNLHYTMCIKYEVLERPDKQVGQPSGFIDGKYKNVIM
jgi:hypothetical protein